MDPKEPIVTAFTNQEYSACLSLLESAPAEVKNLTDMKILQSSCLININGHTNEAHQILDKIIQQEPTNGLAYYSKGLAFIKEGNLEKSFEYFTKAAELDKTGVISKAQVMKLKTEKLLKTQRKSNRLSGRKKKQNSAPQKSISCEVCHKTFAQSFSLNRHKLIHSGERPHKCQLCNFGFVQKSDLQRHMSVHNDTAKFNCELCEKKFKSKKNLMLHIQTHGTEKLFKCYVCGKGFRYQRLMKLHQIIHSKRQKYSCDFCEKIFVTKPSLKAHLMMHINRRNKEVERQPKQLFTIKENGGEMVDKIGENGGIGGGNTATTNRSAKSVPIKRNSIRTKKTLSSIDKLAKKEKKFAKNMRKTLKKIENSGLENFQNNAKNLAVLREISATTGKIGQLTHVVKLTKNTINGENSQNSPNALNLSSSLKTNQNESKSGSPNLEKAYKPQVASVLMPKPSQSLFPVISHSSNADEQKVARFSLGNIELPSSLQIRPISNAESQRMSTSSIETSIDATKSNSSTSNSHLSQISSILSNPQLTVAITGQNQQLSSPKWTLASNPTITEVNKETGLAILHQEIKLEPMDANENAGLDAENSSCHDSLFSNENENPQEWNLFFKSLMHDLTKMDDRQKRKFKQQTFMLIDDILQ